MQEQLISFETAKLAKEKGFKVPTQKAYINGVIFVNFEESHGEREFYFDADDFYEDWNKNGWYFDKDGLSCFGCELDNIKWFEAYAAPTQSLLQKWLREVHKIYIMVYVMEDLDGLVYYEFGIKQRVNWLSDKSCKPMEYNTYEDALEDGLLEALKLIQL